jgi:hypothetical protein
VKPSLGRIIIVGSSASAGDSQEHPAIVNRVWGSDDPADGAHVCVNATVFPDCGAPYSQTSIPLFETREAAIASGFGLVAWWPAKV